MSVENPYPWSLVGDLVISPSRRFMEQLQLLQPWDSAFIHGQVTLLGANILGCAVAMANGQLDELAAYSCDAANIIAFFLNDRSDINQLQVHERLSIQLDWSAKDRRIDLIDFNLRKLH